MSYLDRITINTADHIPRVRGLPVKVSEVLEHLQSGCTVDEVLTRIPGLEREDIFACVEYAAQSNEPPPAAAMRKSG